MTDFKYKYIFEFPLRKNSYFLMTKQSFQEWKQTDMLFEYELEKMGICHKEINNEFQLIKLSFGY
jgi:hypothetical protein